MTHIGILVTTQSNNSGVFQYTVSMIEALTLLPDNKYTIFSPHDMDSLAYFGLATVRLPKISKICLQALTRNSRDGLCRDVDMLISPTHSPYLTLLQKPFVFTLHDLQEKYYPKYFSLGQRIWRHLWKSVLAHRAEQIICESNYVKSDIVRFFNVTEDKIAVVPAPPTSHYGDKPISTEHLNVVHQRFNLADQFIFYPAQFWPHKNHLRLVEAFARIAPLHRNCQLILTGEKKWNFHKVFNLIAQHKLEDQVKHLGYLDNSDIVAIYRLATLVVVPSLFESISIPIYEAFSASVAVCASRVVALPEQLGDAGLLFDPYSVDDIAEKILVLLQNDDLRAHLGQRGKNRLSDITHDKYAFKLNKVLSSVPLHLNKTSLEK